MTQVTVTHNQIEAFKSTWPCNGIPELQGITFEYESNGDLVDISAIDCTGTPIDSAEFDGHALLILSEEYQPK